ncbi:hypothetical protein FA95DRAFT_1611864 [Auriscalpium vulgare]|uniref:Uncharacterized protein n=1 Tax=Auriscalpium vulgare TaxID=40419 RepID=A0ACB8R852_9AGAM|nr:hypothetical protein FA95DRAFT_1611864 [Auriscalpium vulgare]
MQLPASSVPATPATPVLPGLVNAHVPGHQTGYYGVTSTKYAGVYIDWSTVSTLMQRFPDLKFKKYGSFIKAAEAVQQAKDTAALIDQFEAMDFGECAASSPLPSSSGARALPSTPQSAPPSSNARAIHSTPQSSPHLSSGAYNGSWGPPGKWPPSDYKTYSPPASWKASVPWSDGYGEWPSSPVNANELSWVESTIPAPPTPPSPPPVGIVQAPAPTRHPRGRVPPGGWNVYAVARGRSNGIYRSAADALQQTHKFPNALMLGFRTVKEAEQWLEEQRHADRNAIGEEAASEQ